MDGDFGPWTCNSNCCQPEMPDPCECCEAASISIWMQYFGVAYPFLNCTDCTGDPFEVELLPEECLDFDAAGEWIFGFDIEHCPGAPFQGVDYPALGHTECNNTTGHLASGPFNSDSTCYVRCYSASFTGTCYTCTDDGSGFGTPFSERIDYEFRAATYYDSTFEKCYTYLSIFKFHYYGEDAANCDALDPYGVSAVYYLIDNGLLNEADCCGAWNFADLDPPGHCEQSCGFDELVTHGCFPTTPLSDPEHPEYLQITFNC